MGNVSDSQHVQSSRYSVMEKFLSKYCQNTDKVTED